MQADHAERDWEQCIDRWWTGVRHRPEIDLTPCGLGSDCQILPFVSLLFVTRWHITYRDFLLMRTCRVTRMSAVVEGACRNTVIDIGNRWSRSLESLRLIA